MSSRLKTIKMLKLVLLLLVSNALAQLTGNLKQNVELDMELAVCTGAMNCQTGIGALAP